jgi:hypothetical protein
VENGKQRKEKKMWRGDEKEKGRKKLRKHRFSKLDKFLEIKI